MFRSVVLSRALLCTLPRGYCARFSSGLTHVSSSNQPCMVDVGGKAMTRRSAVASATISLPALVLEALRATGDAELYSKKGPVFATAIIAGTMAVKKTAELIPFCHPLPIEKCNIQVLPVTASPGQFTVTCEVGTFYHTGVEMEALTGASVAALTIYDMCKALSHDITISETRLVSKYGGKSDVNKATQV